MITVAILTSRPRGGGVDLGAEPDLAPYLGPRLESRSGSGQQLSGHSLPLSASGRIENVRGVTPLNASGRCGR